MKKYLTLLALLLVAMMISGCGGSRAPAQETTEVTTIPMEQTIVASTENEESVPTETVDPAESNKSIDPPKPTEALKSTEAPKPTETTPPATEALKPTETIPSSTEAPKPEEMVPPTPPTVSDDSLGWG